MTGKAVSLSRALKSAHQARRGFGMGWKGRVRERSSGFSGAYIPGVLKSKITWKNPHEVLEREDGLWPYQTGSSHEICIDGTNSFSGGKPTSGGILDICANRTVSNPINVNFREDRGIAKIEVYGTLYPQVTWGGSGATHGNGWTLPSSRLGELNSYGATAWNRFKPGKPQSSLSVFLAEMRDLPGMLEKKAYAHRNLGKHYLSAQFGWLPFVRDVRKMFMTAYKAEKTFNALRTANGKWQLRKGTVLSNESVLETIESGGDNWGFAPGCWTDLFDSPYSHVKASLVRRKRVWFAGRFCYFIPDLDVKMKSFAWNSNYMRKVMGLTITPGDLWEATPWSWLADYFGNFGDVISNLTNGTVGDVAAKYAYVMCQTDEIVQQTSYTRIKGGPSYSGTAERVLTTKCRDGADPFGFGMSADLSPRQLAILAALGMSRA